MTQSRFTCTLTQAGEPACQSYARVTIMDAGGRQHPRLSSPRRRSARRYRQRSR